MTIPRGFPLDITPVGMNCGVWTIDMSHADNGEWRVVLDPRTVKWCEENIGYLPVLHRIAHIDGNLHALLLFFRDEQDAIVYRLACPRWGCDDYSKAV